jgi:hypothetical protein
MSDTHVHAVVWCDYGKCSDYLLYSHESVIDATTVTAVLLASTS